MKLKGIRFLRGNLKEGEDISTLTLTLFPSLTACLLTLHSTQPLCSVSDNILGYSGAVERGQYKHPLTLM